MAIYTPLSASDREIRLLLLDAGSDDDVLRCNLDVALSYAWGSRSDRVDIELNGEPFSITRNLHAALKRLRYRDKTRTLWVDAVCIDQADNNEKAVQVALMSDIYSRTARCLIWLGEEPDVPVPTVSPDQAQKVNDLILETDKFLAGLMEQFEQGGGEMAGFADTLRQSMQGAHKDIGPDDFRITRTRPCSWYGDGRDIATLDAAATDPGSVQDSIFHAFALFRMLAQDRHLDQIPYLQQEETEGGSSIGTYNTNARRAAHWLASRDWWSRVWTVQECILPRESTVVYGPVETPWRCLLDGILNFLRHRDSCCATVSGVHDMLNFHVETLPELRAIRQLRDAGVPISLTHLLRKFRQRDASNHRDKVYALLPLVTEWYGGGPLAPSYSKSVVQVYTETMVSMIRASRSLDILYRPPEANVDKRLPGLPTWVLDLSHPLAAGGTLDRFEYQLPLYNASAGTPAQIEVLDNGKILALEGLRIDRIKRASTFQAYLHSVHQDSWKDTLKWWAAVAEEELDASADGRLDAFWRTICGDTVATTSPHSDTAALTLRRAASSYDQSDFNKWCAVNDLPELVSGLSTLSPPEGDDGPNLGGAISHVIRATTQQRRFIISQGNRMGLVPNIAVKEFPEPDEIFVFPGGKAPIILRSVGVKEIPGRGASTCYTLLGECYLHGVMNGEGMQGFESEKQTVYIV
ncbi:heterokaryon incompatibility protein-domain-containing protein [Podospora didyma]|uniref:Heterokaryon incompatibility protein-domain-containing protein n=1 Tax=Podospora didyma TaxID=330526 RepID=A0AAE0NZD5_9PEZI|nr:heterokaryon incompatibility protein-domain-containing protein [Podospora didyma]